MPTCFVMQPFDGGVFDRRYEETFKPAIQAADLEAYRVDQDPRVNIPIQDIEAGIRNSQVCLADITKDNPNVWFELGYAIACNKQVVMVCSDERESPKFPFDVAHRSIIRYNTKSAGDYSELARKVTERLKAILESNEALATVAGSVILTDIEGLDQHEIVALATIAQDLDHESDWLPVSTIRRSMEAGGTTRLAGSIAMRSLAQKGLLVGSERQLDATGDNYGYGYSLTPGGWLWVVDNKARFALERPKRRIAQMGSGLSFDDDIPF